MDPILFEKIRYGITYYILLVCSLAIHEWAHAYTADKLGDLLPRTMGRVTLNPLAHMDLIGTVLFPLFMIFSPIIMGASTGIALIGWGKPVITSLGNPKTRTRDDILITLAGPLSNLIIVFASAILIYLSLKYHWNYEKLFIFAMNLNAALFVFNMLPIPPLDGSRAFKYLIGMKEETFQMLASNGFLILLVLINLPPFRHFVSSLIGTLMAYTLVCVEFLFKLF